MEIKYKLDKNIKSLDKNDFKQIFLNIFNFIISNNFIYDADKKFLIKYINSDVSNYHLDCQFIHTIFYYLLYHDSNDNSFVKFYIELYIIKYKDLLKYFWNGFMEFLLEYEFNENKNSYKIIDIYKLCQNNNLYNDLKHIFNYGVIYENIDCINPEIDVYSLSIADKYLKIRSNEPSKVSYTAYESM